MSKKMRNCSCGGDVEIREKIVVVWTAVIKTDWEIYCKKCGGNWQWAADGFYGRDYYSKDEVIDLWNEQFAESEVK